MILTNLHNSFTNILQMRFLQFYIFPFFASLIITFLLVYMVFKSAKFSTRILYYIVQPKDTESEKKNKILSVLFFMILYIILIYKYISEIKFDFKL
jgi:hypothetical protein